MFDLGFWELLFVGIIALVVLGPERLPVAARAVGRWVGKARAYTRSLSNELNREVQLNEMRDKVRAAEASFRAGVNNAGNEIRKLEKPDPDAGFKPVPLAPESSAVTADDTAPKPLDRNAAEASPAVTATGASEQDSEQNKDAAGKSSSPSSNPSA